MILGLFISFNTALNMILTQGAHNTISSLPILHPSIDPRLPGSLSADIDSVNWSPLVANEDQVVAAALRAALEDLFLKYRVDATWHGHHHSYQRTCKLAHGRCVGNNNNNDDDISPAPVHLVIGHGGFGLSPNVHLWRPRIFKKVVLLHGYLRVEANATHMRQQSVISNTGLLMDDFTLIKGPNGGNRIVEHMEAK